MWAALGQHGDDAVDLSIDAACSAELLGSWRGWEYAKAEMLPHLWSMAADLTKPFQQAVSIRCLGALGRTAYEAGYEEVTVDIYQQFELLMEPTGPEGDPLALEVLAAAAQELLDIHIADCHSNSGTTEGALKRVTSWFAGLSGLQQAAVPGKLRGDLRTLLGGGH